MARCLASFLPDMTSD